MKDEIGNNEDVLKILKQWQREIKKNQICTEGQKKYLQTMFENLGFSDITINSNGTADCTIEGYRYEGMYLSGTNIKFENKDVCQIRDVKMEIINDQVQFT